MPCEPDETKKNKTALPVDTLGTCKNARNCGNWQKTYLGNGYCIDCWDKGLGGKAGLTGTHYIRKTGG